MLDLIAVGDVMMDLVLRADRKIVNMLEIEGTNYFSSSKIVPGGSGNVASALSHLGGKTALIGKAGRDAYGTTYIKDLETMNVLPRIELDETASTGFAVSLVEPGGHRTMLVSRGANDKLTKEEVEKHLRQLGPSKFVYLSGYSLHNSPQREAILHAGTIGKENGAHIVFDPGSPNLITSLPDTMKKAIDSCDILCANLAESKLLANGLEVAEYARLLSRNGRKVVIKTGPQGCLISTRGELTNIPGVQSTSLDTTGAGDAFLAALLYGLSVDSDMMQSASFANWFAARKIEGLGPRHFPSKEETTTRLETIHQRKILEKAH